MSEDLGLIDASSGDQTGIVAATNGDVYFLAWYEVRAGQPRIVGARKSRAGEWLDTTVLDLASAASASGTLSVAWSGIYFVVSWVDVAPPGVKAIRIASTGAPLDVAPIVLADTSKGLFDCRAPTCALLAGDEAMVRTFDASLAPQSPIAISVSGVSKLRMVGADILLGHSSAGVPQITKAGAAAPESFTTEAGTLHEIAAVAGVAQVAWYTPAIPGPRRSFLTSLPAQSAPIEIPNFAALALGPLGDGTLIAMRQTGLVARRYAGSFASSDLTLYTGVPTGIATAGTAEDAVVAWTADMRLHSRVVTCAN